MKSYNQKKFCSTLFIFLISISQYNYAWDFDEPSVSSVIGSAVSDIQNAINEGRNSIKTINHRIYKSRSNYWKCEDNCQDEYREFRLSLLEKDIFYAYVWGVNNMVPGGLKPHERRLFSMSMGEVDEGIRTKCAQQHRVWSACYLNKNRSLGDDYLTKCMPLYEPYAQCAMEYEYDHRFINAQEFKDPISNLIVLIKKREAWSKVGVEEIGPYFDYFDIDTIHHAAIIIWMAPEYVPDTDKYRWEKYTYMKKGYPEKLGCDRMRRLHCWRSIMGNGELTPTAEKLLRNYMANDKEGYKKGRARLQGFYDAYEKLYGKPKK